MAHPGMSLFEKNLAANAPFDRTIADLDVHGAWKGIVIGSGPSLDFVYPSGVAQDTYTILCDGSLWEFDWLPDAVITCELDTQDERPGRPSTEQILDYGELHRYRNTPLICTTWGNRYFVERWPGPVYFYHNRDPQYINSPNTTGTPEVESVAPMVGFHAVALCKTLGMHQVDVYGFDCTTFKGKHHSKQFPLDEWEEDLEVHFSKRRSDILIRGGLVGHHNVINHSPLSAIRPPRFNVRMA